LHDGGDAFLASGLELRLQHVSDLMSSGVNCGTGAVKKKTLQQLSEELLGKPITFFQRKTLYVLTTAVLEREEEEIRLT